MSPISTRAYRTLLLSMILALAFPLQAQNLSVDQQIEIFRIETEADRQIIVKANMALTEQESEEFWPVYREYRVEALQVSDKIKNLIVRYAEQYETLSEEAAYSMVAETFPLQVELAKLKQKHLKQFRKVLSPMHAARAMQIENKLDALLTAQIAAAVPAVSSP